jgi:translation initiation factor 4A
MVLTYMFFPLGYVYVQRLLCLQYSDLADRERAMVIEKFRQATINWNQQLNSVVEEGLEESENGKEEKTSHLVVVTDVCLPLLSSGESSLSARVLINYELPTKKETYTRRITTCLASGSFFFSFKTNSFCSSNNVT